MRARGRYQNRLVKFLEKHDGFYYLTEHSQRVHPKWQATIDVTIQDQTYTATTTFFRTKRTAQREACGLVHKKILEAMGLPPLTLHAGIEEASYADNCATTQASDSWTNGQDQKRITSRTANGQSGRTQSGRTQSGRTQSGRTPTSVVNKILYVDANVDDVCNGGAAFDVIKTESVLRICFELGELRDVTVVVVTENEDLLNFMRDHRLMLHQRKVKLTWTRKLSAEFLRLC